jgi:hypothetical protein
MARPTKDHSVTLKRPQAPEEEEMLRRRWSFVEAQQRAHGAAPCVPPQCFQVRVVNESDTTTTTTTTTTTMNRSKKQVQLRLRRAPYLSRVQTD